MTLFCINAIQDSNRGLFIGISQQIDRKKRQYLDTIHTVTIDLVEKTTRFSRCGLSTFF